MEFTEQLIESYCKEQLSSDESRQFERELEKNTQLQKEVRDMMLTIGVLNELRAETIKNRIAHAESQPPLRQLDRKSLWLRWAAAIVLLSIIGFVAYNQLSKQDPQDLYLSYLEPYPNVIDPGTRSAGDEVATRGLQLYEQGNYEAALYSLEKSLETKKNDEELRFYFGLSALYSDEDETAQKALTTVANGNSRLSNQAGWYLALLYIKTHKIDQAKAELDKLIGRESSYSKKAKRLRRKL